MVFKKILIANRGEIALRAVRACRELGITSVAVYSVPDGDALHVREADEAFCIGPAKSSASYLNVNAILHSAIAANCDAIYPGYGFLSENAIFAARCEENRIKFIGPKSKTITLMGDKASARRQAVKFGVPVVPGSKVAFKTVDEASKAAKNIDFPLLLKAKSGGGGKGMQVVQDIKEFNRAFEICKAEAINAFGDGDIYFERYFPNVRHIEIQIFGDGKGNAIALGERDCSIQRRHQKLIEESPALLLNKKSKEKILSHSISLAEGLRYEGAGTIEYILDLKTRDLFFIEMNTRIQVEHPVTEVLINRDLIKAQITIAQGAGLSSLEDYENTGEHAIELRVNAEDWERDFFPSPGKITTWSLPSLTNVRVDSSIYEGCTVLPYYDSMIAKLIVKGRDRKDAIKLAQEAVHNFTIDGVKSTLKFHNEVLKHKDFNNNDLSTHWVENTFLQEKTNE